MWHADADAGRGGVRALAYAPDGGTLYAVTGAGRVQAWDVAAGAGRELFRVDGVDYLAVAVNPVTHDLLVHARSRAIICGYWAWRPSVNRLVYPAAPHTTPAGVFAWDSEHELSRYETSGMAFDAAGRTVYCYKPPEHLILRESYAGQPATPSRTFQAIARQSVGITGTSNGSYIAIITVRGMIAVWDTIEIMTTATVKLPFRTLPAAIAISSAGTLAVSLQDELRFYDAATGTPTAAPLVARPVTLIALSPVADVALTADGSAVVTVWRGGSPVGRFDWKVGKVRAIAVAPDGLTAAVGGTQRQFAVVDLDV